MYAEAMKSVGHNITHLYIASGLLTYRDAKGGDNEAKASLGSQVLAVNAQ